VGPLETNGGTCRRPLRDHRKTADHYAATSLSVT